MHAQITNPVASHDPSMLASSRRKKIITNAPLARGLRKDPSE